MTDFPRTEHGNVTDTEKAKMTGTQASGSVHVQDSAPDSSGNAAPDRTDITENREQGILPPSENAERKSTLKKLFGDLPVPRLRKVIRMLEEMAAAREKEDLERERRETERQEKMLNAVWLLRQSGISPDDFRTFIENGNMENAIQNSRYVYTDLKGMKRFWSGKGKIPTDLAEVMERDGTTKEDYLRRG